MTLDVPLSDNVAYFITITGESIVDDEVVATVNRTISISVNQEADDTYVVQIAIVSSLTLLGLGAAFATDRGRALLFLGLAPLYNRLKPSAVMDNENRGRIVQYLIDNPGAHYRRIKDELELSNGVLGYHLGVLERNGILKSRSDGSLKRFYPHGFEIPPIQLTRKERRIVRVIATNPGIRQSELGERVKLKQSTVSYYIKQLRTKGIVITSKDCGCRIPEGLESFARNI
ncbi:MAG: winged helix-turn-helix transcriptional regulator [Thermoplasmata archaeon]|nr:winged helix-turn-helix transcriptional regulator [Thermoplasmata archaeon]